MLFQTCVGIDIGDSSFSAACLKASFRGVRLVAHATYPFEGAETLEEKAGLIGELVPDLLRKYRISPTSIFLGLPRDLAILRYVDLPIAVKENLRETLRYEMEKYVPFSADEINFDFQIIDEDRGSETMRLALIVVKKETVAFFLPLSNRLSVGISGIEISSTAVANYFASRPKAESTETSAFLYLNGEILEIGLLKEGFLSYSKVVRLEEGGDNFSRLVSNELKALRNGLGKGNGQLETVFCGPEGPMVDRLRGEEGLHIRIVDLSVTGIPSYNMIPAYGLALKGFQKILMDINLLPVELRKKAGKAGYYVMFGLAGLLVLSALAWGGSNVLRHRLTQDRLNNELKHLAVEIADIDRTRKVCKGLENQIDYLNTICGGGVSILDVLKELSQKIPESAWVRGFEFSETGVKIQGEAGSASELIPLLEASPLFNGVAFLSTITKGRDGKDRFRIGLELK